MPGTFSLSVPGTGLNLFLVVRNHAQLSDNCLVECLKELNGDGASLGVDARCIGVEGAAGEDERIARRGKLNLLYALASENEHFLLLRSASECSLSLVILRKLTVLTLVGRGKDASSFITAHSAHNKYMNFTLRIPGPHDGAGFERARQLSWRAAYEGIFEEKLFREREEKFDARAESFSEWFAGLDSNGCDVEAGTGARRCARIAVDEKGEILGTVSTRQAPGETLDLQSLYIVPQAFGTGMGEALMRAVLPEGERVTVEVLATNGRAVAFYRKHGFRDTGKTSTFAGYKTLVLQRG